MARDVLCIHVSVKQSCGKYLRQICIQLCIAWIGAVFPHEYACRVCRYGGRQVRQLVYSRKNSDSLHATLLVNVAIQLFTSVDIEAHALSSRRQAAHSAAAAFLWAVELSWENCKLPSDDVLLGDDS
eukprot:CAMPEP_0117652830 /NCGR_PEP_ID=MMETSP0804-20121206/2847_1 /TAXON_ID=1074897 /ORGANISM="Tetraselmis astigmatica, Strain CCMP880" /LENGTH=126 /DNA_ID=CAMNT_0005458925 /DNA_START=623 /DNA_END=1004 /DNA_ORIENTATION=+